MVTTSCGTVILLPTETIFLSRIIMVPFDNVVLASFTMVALIKAYAFCEGSAIPFTGKVVCAKQVLIKSVVSSSLASKMNFNFLIY